MQQKICSVIGRNAGRLVVILALLLLPAGILFAPFPGHSQNVPPVGNPTIVGTFCPKCKRYIDMPTGKRPSSCPYCGYSFVQTAKPNTIPKLKPINPFGDFLFKDVPIIPDNGKLQTRHFDNDGLAAKAEEWGKEMKQVDAQSRQNQEAQAQEFERKKQELLKGQGNGPALRQLKNIYAGGEDGWDHPANAPDNTGVRIPDHGTVKLLRDPESTGEPQVPKKLSEQPLGTLTDQELAERAAEDQKKIQSLMQAAKRDIDTGDRQQKAWSGVEDDMRTAQGDLKKATFDTGVSLLAPEIVDKSYTLAQDLPELAQASKDNNWVKGIANAGDIGAGFLAEKYAEPYTLSKFGIEYTAALWSLGIGGNTVQQLNAQNQQRLADNSIRTEQLKKLEADQQLIQAENARRAAQNGTP